MGGGRHRAQTVNIKGSVSEHSRHSNGPSLNHANRPVPSAQLPLVCHVMSCKTRRYHTHLPVRTLARNMQWTPLGERLEKLWE